MIIYYAIFHSCVKSFTIFIIFLQHSTNIFTVGNTICCCGRTTHTHTHIHTLGLVFFKYSHSLYRIIIPYLSAHVTWAIIWFSLSLWGPQSYFILQFFLFQGNRNKVTTECRREQSRPRQFYPSTIITKEKASRPRVASDFLWATSICCVRNTSQQEEEVNRWYPGNKRSGEAAHYTTLVECVCKDSLDRILWKGAGRPE